MSYRIVRLETKDMELYHCLNSLFAKEFEDLNSYTMNRPDDEYVKSILTDQSIVVLVAMLEDEIVGGLVAYELRKLEQQRSEIYIYDLAVSEAHRRQGIATSLIEHLKPIAKALGAWVIFVQADYVDKPAVALYSKLGVREDVLHFDIEISSESEVLE